MSSTSRQYNDNVSIFTLDVPYQVNESLFSDNQEKYDKVNSYLLLARDMHCLNYDNVCSFIKILNDIIERSENDDDIAGGF